MKRVIVLLLLIIIGVTSLVGYSNSNAQKTVIIYTAVDQIYAEPIFKDFEGKTGIKVKAVHDLEANKTTGLTNRLIAEKEL